MATMEQRLISIVQAIGTDIKAARVARGDLSTLGTTEQTNLVGAINELLSERGALSALTTTAKTSIVAAINELVTGQTSAATAISTINAAIGTLSALTTTAKSSLVLAINELVTTRGNLALLNTTAKGSIVAAINEIQAALATSGVAISDTAGDGDSTVTWSANKIFDTIEAAKLAIKSEILDGAGTALDTLNELSAALGDDPQFATTIATSLAARLRFDAVQTLTIGQKTQACANLGIGEPDTDFVSYYIAAKV